MDEDFVVSLRKAVKDCSERGLHYASKWASELLLAIPEDKRRQSREQGIRSSTTIQFASHENLAEANLEEDEQDLLGAGLSYAGTREYMRASNLLQNCKSAKGRFMYRYFDFLAEEKKALRDWHNLDYSLQQKTTNQPATPINKSLQELLEVVNDETEPWLLFLKALFLKRLTRKEEAVEVAILSIRGYCWNWSAWLLLASCLGDRDELSAILPHIHLPTTHPLVELFKLKVLIDLHAPVEEELATCDRLLRTEFFPNSTWIMSMRAATLYHLHEFQKAEAQFDGIMKLDPMRVDDIDILSNILYVADNRSKLSKLAHHFLTVDKDRPEVCCMVGNYYSLRQEPERAIQYFRRATELDQSYLPAWTLMGHEFVEIKNSHAAIESYRRAIDVNRKDYRAWYGLGQAYELLNMHQYSLHYYQRATTLRPYDVRIWQAQGMCYEEMGRPREAIECLRRALLGADPADTQIAFRLAKLHDEVEDFATAAAYHQRIIDISTSEVQPTFMFAKSLVYVARYHIERGGGDFILARQYAEQVAVSNSEEVTAASELLRKLQALAQVNEVARDAMAGPSRVASVLQTAHSTTSMDTGMYGGLQTDSLQPDK